jgi:aryl-alcohol dehydrogenase-like predicted oxidoreductase
VWSPLGWGRLTGKIRRGQPVPENTRMNHKPAADAAPPVPQEYMFEVIDALDRVAQEVDKSVAQVALNWLLQRPTVSTLIIGARNEEQLRQNLDVVSFKLTSDQVSRLDQASSRTKIYPYWHQAGFRERNPFPTAP